MSFPLAISRFSPLVFALVLLFIIVNSIQTNAKVNFDDLALGQGNKDVFTCVEGEYVHCGDVVDAKKCISAFKGKTLIQLSYGLEILRFMV